MSGECHEMDEYDEEEEEDDCYCEDEEEGGKKKKKEKKENFDKYVTKKSFVSGMLDLGLLITNASQLKALIDLGPDGGQKYWYPLIVLIGISLLLQITVGIIFLILSTLKVKPSKEKKKKKGNKKENQQGNPKGNKQGNQQGNKKGENKEKEEQENRAAHILNDVTIGFTVTVTILNALIGASGI